VSEPASKRSRELGRADRVLPGLWRLRLPLPWPGVPHVNAFAIAAGSGVVLVDTGIHEPGSLAQLERALDQANLKLEHVRLLVCTHAHFDHYGMAATIVQETGCELWMHPNHAHVTEAAADPARQLERRIEVARQSGVPPSALESYRERNEGQPSLLSGVVLPDRELVPGVEVDSDLGRWQVHETPGHAPSHVVLHQPERKLLLSGDHLLGRISLYFDFGHTPDPAGEFLTSLDTVGALDIDLVLAGHGRPVRDAPGLIEGNRREVAGGLERITEALAGHALTPYEIVPKLLGVDELSPMQINWGLSITLSYMRHLELRGEVERYEDDGSERWSLAKS